MPLTYEVDSDRRLVIATGHGVLTDGDIFGYQETVWSRPEVRGFDEIVDVTGVEKIEYQSHQRVGKLAELSAGMDSPAKTRLAIVAPDATAFGLARMYQAYRGLQARSTKEVAVFRDLAQALQWLSAGRPAAVPSGQGT